MAFITKILGKILGNKSERDINEVIPLVEKAKAEFERLAGLSNDELRAETEKIRETIKLRIREEEEEIASLKEKVEDIDIQESEKLYERIDKLEEIIIEKLEAVLNEVLPVAFAIVKETANRFCHHECLEVSARDFDRDLAA